MSPVEKSPKGEVTPPAMAMGILVCALAGAAIHHFAKGDADGPVAPATPVADVRGAPIDAPPVLAPPEGPEPPDQPGQPGPAPVEATPPEPLPLLGTPQQPEAQPESSPEGTTQTPEGAPDGGDRPLFKAITFNQLADWTYEFPEVGSTAPRDEPVPERIRDWSGTKIAIQGFMIPVKLEGEDSVTEFLLVRNQFACCFGVVPKMNEWVHVVMAPGKASRYLVDVPITVRGTFDASELIEDGLVMSLYRVTADAVDEPAFLR